MTSVRLCSSSRTPALTWRRSSRASSRLSSSMGRSSRGTWLGVRGIIISLWRSIAGCKHGTALVVMDEIFGLAFGSILEHDCCGSIFVWIDIRGAPCRRSRYALGITKAAPLSLKNVVVAFWIAVYLTECDTDLPFSAFSSRICGSLGISLPLGLTWEPFHM